MRDRLATMLQGHGAHMSFEDAIANFPMDTINTRPPDVPYTFWHLIEHMRITQWDILEFTRNPEHVSPPHPEGYWPEPNMTTDEAGWQRTLASFRSELQEMVDLATDPELELLAELPHAPGYTLFREILTLADHNSYHTGEFAILRQTLGLWTESASNRI